MPTRPTDWAGFALGGLADATDEAEGFSSDVPSLASPAVPRGLSELASFPATYLTKINYVSLLK